MKELKENYTRIPTLKLYLNVHGGFIPYTWKFSRYVIFTDFTVDQVTAKI